MPFKLMEMKTPKTSPSTWGT